MAFVAVELDTLVSKFLEVDDRLIIEKMKSLIDMSAILIYKLAYISTD